MARLVSRQTTGTCDPTVLNSEQDYLLQAAVASNTRALVQRNTAAQAVSVSGETTPAKVTFSPCGEQMAWETEKEIMVKDRRAGRQVIRQPLPRDALHRRDLQWSYSSSHVSVSYYRSVWVLDLASSAAKQLDLGGHHFGCAWAPSALILAVNAGLGLPSGYSMSDFKVAGADAHLVLRLEIPPLTFRNPSTCLEWAPIASCLQPWILEGTESSTSSQIPRM